MSSTQLNTAYTNLSDINLNSSSLKKYKELLTYLKDLVSYEVHLRTGEK
ncbi:MAG: hypothetical protein LBC61_03125 [Candidatus Peribacteria bacterium]|nr:hypothetical protein [Candidatus Peribacteria bacterium]